MEQLTNAIRGLEREQSIASRYARLLWAKYGGNIDDRIQNATNNLKAEESRYSGLTIGDCLLLDANYLSVFNKNNPSNLRMNEYQWIPGDVVEVTNIHYNGHYWSMHITHLTKGWGVGGISLQDAQRMKQLYVKHNIADYERNS